MKLTILSPGSHKKAFPGCVYEVWDKNAKRLVACGKASAVKAGGQGYLCAEHAEYVAAQGGGEFLVEEKEGSVATRIKSLTLGKFVDRLRQGSEAPA